jgi:coenzyme F420-reducing hydrogenase alpha subunit
MASKDIKIGVHHVTRVEGHGNIEVDIEGGTVNKIEWQVPEAPRFFEAFVRGRSWEELAPITSRICGICSIGHTFASLKATEAAMKVPVSKQSLRLREILTHAETLQSHVLHVCYLVLPDLLKAPSVIALAGTHKDAVLLAVKLHRLANETCDIIGGRTTHPIRACVGGWTKLPTEAELESLLKRWKEAVGDLKAVADLVKALAGGLPAFSRETEYISLTDKKEYAFYDGDIKSSDVEKTIPVKDYKKVTNEYVHPKSTAKWARFNREAYMASALARFNNNHSQLTPLSKKVATALGLAAPCYNPFMNNVAQVVESVFAVERGIHHMEQLIGTGLKAEKLKVRVRAGTGAGAVEVPRGVLFHEYTYDKKGRCIKANCIIPTNQNHGNIQKDMEKLVPEFKDRGKEELQFMLEMLVRAYDPCISCSTHLLNVRFV